MYSIIEEHIGNREYLEEMTTNWTNAILEKCVVALTKLQEPFEYIGKHNQSWTSGCSLSKVPLFRG